MTTIPIIIPARNEEDNLPKLIRSLLAQPVKPCEIIVVDAASTDRTAEMARQPGAVPVLIAVTAREEEMAAVPWLGRALREHDKHGLLVRAMLEPLTRPDTIELLGWHKLLSVKGSTTWGNMFPSSHNIRKDMLWYQEKSPRRSLCKILSRRQLLTVFTLSQREPKKKLMV